nr:Plug domain-containing protein [Deltaproteobacteria bacterium]
MSNSRFKYISSLVGCIVLVLVVAISWEDAAATETEADSSAAPLYRLEQVIVSVERTKNPIADSTAAVSVLKSEDIRKFPLLNISDALNILPGITFFNHDGIGRDSIANVRGFHGGGEVEYILVLMDGQPLNDIETGLVNWNSVPLSNIESIEVIRGGASSLYGDAAIGGLVNILTRKDSPASTFLSTTGGRFGVFNAQAQTNGVWDGHKYMFFASEDWNDGFRDHAEQRVENIGGSFSLLHTQNHSLSIST